MIGRKRIRSPKDNIIRYRITSKTIPIRPLTTSIIALFTIRWTIEQERVIVRPQYFTVWIDRYRYFLINIYYTPLVYHRSLWRISIHRLSFDSDISYMVWYIEGSDGGEETDELSSLESCLFIGDSGESSLS